MNFNFTDKDGQLYDVVKNDSMKPQATEGNILDKQSKGFFKCNFCKKKV